ncbi:exosome component 4 (predicted), isoform CRA_a [Rattus norvegicus]|uniref:Exosome component 4 (Predicted), isoform CRA_a n=1 Tax=Rattus norvegicus TaxID=10116 RepID=A6HS80_RAT|nr:exosome component 4 (predicted), isoform CRA_a [Rattus norvegicus]
MARLISSRATPRHWRWSTGLTRRIRGSRSRALPDRALVNCQYSSATFSTARDVHTLLDRVVRQHVQEASILLGD